jgi:catechol 2,3-dioxygenase-like lactoylglutathione lyase family enzyme
MPATSAGMTGYEVPGAMIDHVSIGVSDLDRATRFYEAVLATIGFAKIDVRPKTVGFGKSYSEFWLNHRPGMAPVAVESGGHVCLRARSTQAVDAFHAAALASGGSSDGAPTERPQHGEGYYAAFVRDPDGNRIEVVTFLRIAAG